VRAVIAVVAEHVAAKYELPIAADLANSMHADDPELHVVASELRNSSG
jgi:hypothetical protein